MDINLENRRAVVCGSTGGIGRASAFELASMGASVTLVSRNVEKLQQTVNELPRPSSQQHGYLEADFLNPDTLKNALEKFEYRDSVSILVNNTGGPPPGPALHAKPEEFLQAFNAHLVCNQLLVQAFVEGMKRSKYGRIINIISTSVKSPIKGLGVSNTVRAAVANWSKTLAAELGPFGITVNNVLPGATMTARLTAIISATAQKTGKSFDEAKADMVKEIPASRIAEPEEVAAAVAFLASPAAAYINGINLPVDGGRTGNL
jgi:3-oxoacyl-[acyl-carrier protein] reductase